MSLKILSIGSDRNLFVEGSPVSQRIKEYGSLVDELHIVVTAKSSLRLKEKQIGRNVWLYPTNSLSRWFYPWDAARIGKKIIFDKKFVRGESVITAQDPFESGMAASRIAKRWRLPLEVQLHTDPFSPFFKGFLNSIRARIARIVVRRANLVRVVSQTLANSVSRSFNIPLSKISVLPIFIDKEAIEKGTVLFDLHSRFGWSFILLTACRLTKEKDVGFAIDVLKLLSSKYSNVGLVIVGSGPEESTLRKHAQTLQINNQVTFVGWQENLASYYKTANLYIQTSKFEGYGLSMIEAGISGLPIVTTPVGVATEFDNGKDLYICPPGNVEYFAEAIADLIENNQKRENMKVNMRHSLENKLISKEEYLKKLKENWDKVALDVKP